MKTNPLLVAVAALKEIQYRYSGAGNSHEDLCVVKSITEKALRNIGMFDMSLVEFRQFQQEADRKVKRASRALSGK